MRIKKTVFIDNLSGYDADGNWDVFGDDATYASTNDYLNTWKTNSDIHLNYIKLTSPFNETYDFTTEIDFSAIIQASGTDMKILEVMDGTTSRGSVRIGASGTSMEFYDEDNVQMGTAYDMSLGRWYRLKLSQSFNQQTSSTGRLAGFVKDMSNVDNDWEFVGANSTQGGGITDIFVGHPEISGETYHYQFKNLIIYRTEEYP